MSQRSIFRRQRQAAVSQVTEQVDQEEQEEQEEHESTQSPSDSFRSPASPTLVADVAGGAVEILRSKLRALRLTELLRRAEDAGVDPDALDEVVESSEQPKDAVVDLIVQQLVPSMGGVVAHALASVDNLDTYNDSSTHFESSDGESFIEQHECVHSENDGDDPQAWRMSERCESPVETMMRQFAVDDCESERCASDDGLSEGSLGNSSNTSGSERLTAVASRQRMHELSQPLPRHQQSSAKRTQDSPAWRPGGAAAVKTQSSVQDVAVSSKLVRKAWINGGTESWHVADCAARSAKQRLARRRKAQAVSTPKETHRGFGSSTQRTAVTTTPTRRVPSHVLVSPPRPELTRPSRGIRSTTSGKSRAQAQRAFGSALSTHRGVPGEALLPWQRRNSQPSFCTKSTAKTNARGRPRSAQQQQPVTPQPSGAGVDSTASSPDISSMSTPPISIAAPDAMKNSPSPQTHKLDGHARVLSGEVATASARSDSDLRPDAQLSGKRRRRRRFLRALQDVEAESDDALSFREGDLVILLAKPKPQLWMGYVHGARSRLGMFPAKSVKTMRSVCVVHDIAPGMCITVALPKKTGTLDVLLPLGAKRGSDVVFALPSEASSLTKMNAASAVRVAGEVVLPEDQEEQLELHLRQVARNTESESSDAYEESWPSVAEIPSSQLTTSEPSSGLLTVKVLELRLMKNGVLKKDDRPLRLLVGRTEKRVARGTDASFDIHKCAESATMVVVLDSPDGTGSAQASIELSTAIRSRLLRSWHTLYCDSTEQKNHCLLHLELRFDSAAKFPEPSTPVSSETNSQHRNESSLDDTDQYNELLERSDATVAAVEDFCENEDAGSVLCLTGPQGSGKQHFVETLLKRWKGKLTGESGVQSPVLFICHIEMGSACITSPRKFILQVCAEMIRMQPSLLPCDLTGDIKKLVRTWVDLSRRLVAICGSVIFALCGIDRMLTVPGSWFPTDLPRGVKILLPVTIWLPSDITSQPCEELELPAMTLPAAKLLIQRIESAASDGLEDVVKESILTHSASTSPLFVILSCRVSSFLRDDVARTCRSVSELFKHCVQLAQAQLGRTLDSFFSLIALALSVGTPLRSLELEALLEDIESRDNDVDQLSGQDPESRFRVGDLQNTALGCFVVERSDSTVMLFHDVIVAEVCNLYDIIPASPPDGATRVESGTKNATKLHDRIGNAFYLQTRSAVNKYTSSRSSPSQTVGKAQIVRAAEIAVVHWFAQHTNPLNSLAPVVTLSSAFNSMLCIELTKHCVCVWIFSICAGKWSEAWQCISVLQGIRQLRSVCNALTLTVDDLSSVIDGAALGLAQAKEALQQDRSQSQSHVHLTASA